MTSRPVVAHVMHSLQTGGLENGVVNLVNTTDDRVRHVIVCMTEAGPLRSRVKPAVEVFTLGKRPGQDVGAFLRLLTLLRRIRPAVVHTRNWAAFDAIPAARLAGVRVLVHGEHGREVDDPEGRDTRRNRIRRLFAPLVSQFVTVSRDLERWLVEDVGLPARKVMTIHNGVDLARFGQGDRREARDRLGLPPDATIVGTVGRLDPVKDQAGLLRAFAALTSLHPGAMLVIAGDGPCREELTRLAEALGVEGRVRMLGDCRDVPGVLAALDIFVLPSIAEGMSNTILEAMASALPVVATRVGGNPELVEDHVTGRLVVSRDPKALAEVMAVYLDDAHLRALHGKTARQRVAERFALDRMCESYVELYRRRLGGRPAAGS